MKMLYFNYKNKTVKKESKDMIERILFTVFIALLTLVILSQVSFLRTNTLNPAVAKDAFEGTPLGAEEYLYVSGTIELRLMSGEKAPQLAVLVNGQKAAVFDNRDIKLEVAEGDIVELDGSESNECEVAVCAISNDLQKDIIGKVFNVNGKVERIMTVKAAAGQ